MSREQYAIPVGSRPISWAPAYRVCDGGAVWSCYSNGGGMDAPWHLRKTYKGRKCGRMYVGLHVDGKCYVRMVHRLVAGAFLGPCPPGLEVCHYDGDSTNNFVSNLRYDTHLANEADKRRHGTLGIGERNAHAKLKDADVVEIFHLAAEGWSVGQIAGVFGVVQSCVSSILSRKKWIHVEVDAVLLDRANWVPSEWAQKWASKLKESDIPEIFRLRAAGMSQGNIAKRFGVTKANVKAILQRRIWVHVAIDPLLLHKAG